MRLIFSNSYYKNTDISDEAGKKLYTISTPPGWKQVTTITKYQYRKGKGRSTRSEVLCVIEWHRVKKTKFRFGEREVDADNILYQRPFSWYVSNYLVCFSSLDVQWRITERGRGRYFRGPDGRTYKWKVGFRFCWLKNEKKHSRARLAKFHKRNLGIRKPCHPPFLEVAEEVAHMLDYIIITYVYMERMRRDVEDEKLNLELQ